MHGLGNISRMGEKTRLQSTTGTILHFLWVFFSFFLSSIPAWIWGDPIHRSGDWHRHSSERSLRVLVQGVRQWVPDVQREGKLLSFPSVGVRVATVTVLAMGACCTKT